MARYRPFYTYSMRQAIEEGFILDVPPEPGAGSVRIGRRATRTCSTRTCSTRTCSTWTCSTRTCSTRT